MEAQSCQEKPNLDQVARWWCIYKYKLANRPLLCGQEHHDVTLTNISNI